MKHLLFLGAVELGSRLFLPAAFGSLMSTSIAVAQTSDQVPRGAIAAELYFPEDRDNRDIRVATLSAESERHLGAGVWLRGALGLVFTEGVKVEDDGPQSAELEADAVGLADRGRKGVAGRRVGEGDQHGGGADLVATAGVAA